MGFLSWLGLAVGLVGFWWLGVRLRMTTEEATVVRKPSRQYLEVLVELVDGERVRVGMERDYQLGPGDVVDVSVRRRPEETVVVFGGGWRRLYGPSLLLLAGVVLLVWGLALSVVENLWPYLVLVVGGLVALVFLYWVFLMGAVVIPVSRGLFGQVAEVVVEGHKKEGRRVYSTGTFTSPSGKTVQVQCPGEIPLGSTVEVKFFESRWWPLRESAGLEAAETWRVIRRSARNAMRT